MKKITSLMSILVIMALVIFPISAFALIGDGKSIEIDSMKKVDKSQDKYTFSFENTLRSCEPSSNDLLLNSVSAEILSSSF